MKGVVQRFPAGLLPLLSIKESETPHLLSEEMGASLEMSPFFLSDRIEVQTASAVAQTAPAQFFLPVPAGEYWWLYNVSIIGNNISAPGASVQLGCGIADQAGGLAWLGAMLTPTVSVAGQAIVVPASVPVPILLKPGMQIFGSMLVDPGAQTVDLTLRALVSRLSPQ